MELILPPSRNLSFGKQANSSSVKSLLTPTQSARTACFFTFRIYGEETGATGFDFKLEIIGLQIQNSTWRRMRIAAGDRRIYRLKNSQTPPCPTPKKSLYGGSLAHLSVTASG